MFQDANELKRKPPDECSWYAGWLDGEGRRRCKSCGTGPQGKKRAGQLAREIEVDMRRGAGKTATRTSWERFMAQYRADVLATMKPGPAESALKSLRQFERVAKPTTLDRITTAVIDAFKARRLRERGRHPESAMAAASVNKDLRHVKAALRRAHDWKMIGEVPKIRMLKEKEKEHKTVSPEHFDAMYNAADAAKRPAGPAYTPGAWWRALLTLAYTTGWRRSELLGLRWVDVFLDRMEVVTRDNKASREEATPLHPVAAEHLRAIFDPEDVRGRVFAWDFGIERLYAEFRRIQKAAGVEVGCPEVHKHTPGCRFYAFHALRRGFATANAASIPAEAVQKLMRHRSYTTTQRYIAMARHMRDIVDRLAVPESARTGGMRERLRETGETPLSDDGSGDVRS